MEGMAVERVPDSTDEITLEVQRNLVADALSRASTVLRQVSQALERIARGKFGLCQVCQEKISPKRLAALPWADLCLECQQAAENRQGAEARASTGPRLGFGLLHEGPPMAASDSGYGNRLRKPAIPSGPNHEGMAKSEP
jgi:RNA polymerase-binding protein DksA